MDSVIVRAATRLMLPLLILFSIFLFLRGHNAPGGGFAGGLVLAAAVILLALAGGRREAEAILPAATARYLMAVGLLVAGLAASSSLARYGLLMKGMWTKVAFPGLPPIEVGTPMLFDLGVELVVIGMVLTVVLRLIGEVERWKP